MCFTAKKFRNPMHFLLGKERAQLRIHSDVVHSSTTFGLKISGGVAFSIYQGVCKKMYLAVLEIFDKVFDADLGNGICIS